MLTRYKGKLKRLGHVDMRRPSESRGDMGSRRLADVKIEDVGPTRAPLSDGRRSSIYSKLLVSRAKEAYSFREHDLILG